MLEASSALSSCPTRIVGQYVQPRGRCSTPFNRSTSPVPPAWSPRSGPTTPYPGTPRRRMALGWKCPKNSVLTTCCVTICASRRDRTASQCPAKHEQQEGRHAVMLAESSLDEGPFSVLDVPPLTASTPAQGDRRSKSAKSLMTRYIAQPFARSEPTLLLSKATRRPAPLRLSRAQACRHGERSSVCSFDRLSRGQPSTS